MFIYGRHILFFICIISCLPSATWGQDAAQYKVLEWTDLIPKDDLDVLLNPPKELMNVEDGSEEDSITKLDKLSEKSPEAKRYYQALKSTKVVKSMNGKQIQIPGFVVPISGNDEKKVTEFFIVPYFGACIHLPPPPPNQVIFGKITEGFKLDSIYEPFLFSGKLSLQQTNHSLGDASYQIDVDEIVPYQE